MFGLGKKMSNMEKEEMYKQELKALEDDERVAKLKDKVYEKKKTIKMLKTKRTREAFQKIGATLERIKKNNAKNKKKAGSIFGDTNNKRGIF